jgi:hypothetical protein
VSAVAGCLVTSVPASAGYEVPRPTYIRCYDVTVTVGGNAPVVTVCSPV